MGIGNIMEVVVEQPGNFCNSVTIFRTFDIFISFFTVNYFSVNHVFEVQSAWSVADYERRCHVCNAPSNGYHFNAPSCLLLIYAALSHH